MVRLGTEFGSNSLEVGCRERWSRTRMGLTCVSGRTVMNGQPTYGEFTFWNPTSMNLGRRYRWPPPSSSRKDPLDPDVVPPLSNVLIYEDDRRLCSIKTRKGVEGGDNGTGVPVRFSVLILPISPFTRYNRVYGSSSVTDVVYKPLLEYLNSSLIWKTWGPFNSFLPRNKQDAET